MDSVKDLDCKCCCGCGVPTKYSKYFCSVTM